MAHMTYTEGPDIDFRIANGPTLEVLGIALHNHFDNPESDCSYRWGVMITILGIGVIFGWFRRYD